ncbi:MAG: 4-hydroxy-tetrahydrodipicolinate reductase [Defluviitaleaceae bacterium]|nr:4-hydroxy-tetrahydrodipicolinate reductase [Defluviitaleaceae bacterium]MCL2275203.1 4-hydroxy-tetrahydrodipicolinate reductase [Defluviitaleaceae bacterium]
MTRIIVCGCFGRLGAAICKLAKEDTATELIAGIDVVTPAGEAGFPVFTNFKDCESPADAVVICMPPSAADEVAAVVNTCTARKIPIVLCTTALPDAVMDAVKKSAENIAVLASANMSLGINLLNYMIGKATRLLHDANFDIEIIERHHNKKLDAPSGTAYLLANTANAALDGKMTLTTDHSPHKTPRNRNEIGLHALRGGTFIGEHTVVYAGLDEVVELTHIAQSRDVFAAGALKAAQFVKENPAGYYSMQDLIEGV